MTESEAIKQFKERIDIPEYKEQIPEYYEAMEMAINALEKQIAKKPKKIKAEGYRYTDTYRCPLCGGNFSGTGIADYCYHCGQKLDWSDEE